MTWRKQASLSTQRKVVGCLPRSLNWLGFRINLAEGMFLVPPKNLVALKAMVNHIIATPEVTARQLASVIGKIISMSLGLGPITHWFVFKFELKNSLVSTVEPGQ